MVKMNINDVKKIITSQSFFSNIGKTGDVFEIVTIDNIEDAIRFWKSKSFEDAQFLAWESMRTHIVQNSEKCTVWNAQFYQCKNLLIERLGQIDEVKRLALLAKETLVKFIEKLPFIGAIGESLIQEDCPQNNFFLSQMTIYSQGHWVCGWEGIYSFTPFIYPSGKYIVY